MITLKTLQCSELSQEFVCYPAAVWLLVDVTADFDWLFNAKISIFNDFNSTHNKWATVCIQVTLFATWAFRKQLLTVQQQTWFSYSDWNQTFRQIVWKKTTAIQWQEQLQSVI